jgi:HK97 family phage prohead protease
MQAIQYKSAIPLEIKEVGPRGEFAGWGAIVGTEDDGGDTILSGSMRKSLRKRTPKIYLGHESSVGVYKIAEEKDKGLWVEGQPDDSRDGQDARAKLISGALDSLSIGYRTVKAKDTGRFKRDLIEIDVYHVGLVPFGMHEDARVTAVKAFDLERISTVRELENLLRDAGFSKSAAERFCSAEYIKSLKRGDPDEDEVAAVLRAFGSSAAELKKR